MTTAPVFIVPEGSLAAADADRSYLLAGPKAHHAATVVRLRIGERLDLVDGAGVRARATVSEILPGPQLRCDILDVEVEPSRTPPIILVQALAKGGRDEQAIETATEFGVDAVCAWQAERSIVRWRGERAARGLASWRSVLERATQQSRRAYVPRLVGPRNAAGEVLVAGSGPGADLATYVRSVVSAGGHAAVLHESATDALASLPIDAGGVDPWLIIVGPEGGISDTELAALTAAGGQTVRLGPDVLRSANAGPAAIAVLNVRTGRW